MALATASSCSIAACASVEAEAIVRKDSLSTAHAWAKSGRPARSVGGAGRERGEVGRGSCGDDMGLMVVMLLMRGSSYLRG